jgi:hypothetical protein
MDENLNCRKSKLAIQNTNYLRSPLAVQAPETSLQLQRRFVAARTREKRAGISMLREVDEHLRFVVW